MYLRIMVMFILNCIFPINMSINVSKLPNFDSFPPRLRLYCIRMQAFTCALGRSGPLLTLSAIKRNFFTTRTKLFSPKIDIAPYLLDRTKPAEEILSNLTSDDAHRLVYIKAEHSMLIARGKEAPLDLTPSEYLELLCCPSLSARNRYYSFRYKVSKKKEAKKAKQTARLIEEVIICLII